MWPWNHARFGIRFQKLFGRKGIVRYLVVTRWVATKNQLPGRS